MKSATDKLLDLLREGQWTTPQFSRVEVVVNATQEMRILPETKNGPMLEVVSKDENDTVIHRTQMNLSAVDHLIGKLIKMRDHMAQMKG